MTVFQIAYRLLGQHEANGTYINLSLSSHLTDGLSKENKALLTALLYKTVEKKLTYDYYISAFAKRGINEITPSARDALRLGICALVDMKSIPDHAAVNEAVGLCALRSEKGFVNGVLRAVARAEQLPMPDRKKNFARFLSVYYSMPLPTVKYFISLFGEADTEKIFLAFEKKNASLSITPSLTKTTADELIKKLSENGIEATRAKFSPLTLRISRSMDPRQIPGFSEGEFFIQDEASSIPALVLGACAGEIIIDTCAAPGGKSFLLAALAGDRADVRSFDIHESKIPLITSGAERLGLSSVKAEARDALSPDPSLFGKADAVLCDVPCSGLGVLAKKPDLRYKDVIAATEELVPLQLGILTASAQYVKPGGRLVYSTCTLSPKENREVVEAFLGQSEDFTVEDFSVGELRSEGGSLTLYPHIHGTDGFFITKLRKKK